MSATSAQSVNNSARHFAGQCGKSSRRSGDGDADSSRRVQASHANAGHLWLALSALNTIGGRCALHSGETLSAICLNWVLRALALRLDFCARYLRLIAISILVKAAPLDFSVRLGLVAMGNLGLAWSRWFLASYPCSIFVRHRGRSLYSVGAAASAVAAGIRKLVAARAA